MPLLKVCGINDAEFACGAAQRGVDFLGFVFAEDSPRRVSPRQAKEIAAVCDGPRFAGVFTTQSAEEILETAGFAGLDIVQLHGPYPDSVAETIKSNGYEVWRLWNGERTANGTFAEDAVLVDGRKGDKSMLADWSIVPRLKAEGRRVVLAGAISAGNIADAMRSGADVIDVSSSLETSPGRKSLALLEALLEAIGKDASRP